MSHPLDKLFLLFEAEIAKKPTPIPDKKVSGNKKKVDSNIDGEELLQAVATIANPQPEASAPTPKRKKPSLKDVVHPEIANPPTKDETLESPDAQARTQVDTLRKSGVSTTDAHQQVHGDVDIGSVESRASLAATLGRVQDDQSDNEVHPDKDSESGFAQLSKLEKEADAVSPEDLATPLEGEIPDELQGAKVKEVDVLEKEVNNRINNELDDSVVPGQQTPRQIQDEEEKKTYILSSLEKLLANPELSKGAGANDLSPEDVQAMIRYTKEGRHPDAVVTEISDEDVDFAYNYLKEKAGDKKGWTSLLNKLKNKGDPPKGMKVVARAKEVLRSFLENGGISAVTGLPMAYSESQLDHMTSLDNGGVDGRDNWSWMEKRFNQTKSSLTDEALLAKLQKRLEADPDNERLKKMEKDLTNSIRGGWNSYFTRKGWDNLTQADIESAKGTDGMQMLKALAEVAGISHYVDRGKDRDSGRAGGGVAMDINTLKKRLINELDIESTDQINKFDEELIELMQELSDKSADVKSTKKELSAKKRAAEKATVKEAYLEWLLETKFGYFYNKDKVTYLEEEEEGLTEEEDWDYNEDVLYLTTYGRA
jgi:hypothetical protein